MKNIMKKILFSVFCLACVIKGYAQGGVMRFNGKDATYEIRDDRRVGPGIKYTEYYFANIQYNGLYYKMRALVVEIDNEKKNYQTAFMAKYDQNHEYHQSTTQAAEYKQQKLLGKTPVVSVMADGFHQAADNGVNLQWEVPGGLVANGIMHYMPQSNAPHYYLDGNGKMNIGVLTCAPTVSAESAGEHKINVFNRMRSVSPNGITLFANGYGYKGKFQTADLQENKNLGTEVVVSLDNADGTICSGVYTGTVVKKLEGSFNNFEKGQVVLASVSGDGDAWLQKLTEGEKVTINMQYQNAAGENVALQSCMRAFSGYAVKAGVAQPSKVVGYQQDALGLSKDGKKSFYVHLDQNTIDGAVGYSNAPIAVFNQFISQIDGLYEAVLTDGGPSAEMVVNGESVSVTHGRDIPAALIVYSTANLSGMAKGRVSAVDFKDYLKRISVGETYTPDFYCFNSGDEVIDKAVPSTVKLSCDESLGTISADGRTFTAKAGGTGKLYCEYNGRKDEMWIEVAKYIGIRVEPDTYSGSMYGTFDAKLYGVCADGTEELIDNSEAVWTASNTYSVTSCADGHIKLGTPGNALVTVEYKGYKAEINISVVTAIEQVEQSAPVSVSSYGDKIVFTANDAASMSCVLYSVDGKVIDQASANGAQLTVSRRGAASPVLVKLIINGIIYIYKLI